MEEMDNLEKLTTKIFEIKEQLKENDYIMIMNFLKDCSGERDVTVKHRLYYTITTLYTIDDEAEMFKTSFFIRVKGRRKVNEVADWQDVNRIETLLKEDEFNFLNINQVTIMQSYFGIHLKRFSNILTEISIHDTKVSHTSISPFHVRPEKENEDYDQYPIEFLM